jgi:DNA-binding MarR family transcriptional regulator
MQISQDAINYGDPQQQPHAGQAGQFFEELMEILVKVTPPPDEVLQLATRLEGAQFKDKPHLIFNPVAFRRIGSFLHQNPGSTMGQLSQAISVPLYTATRMIDTLVENGLADRLSDPDDRRIVRVTLTDKGLRLHETIEARLAQDFQGIMACLTPEEQRILIPLLHKVAASLKESKT